jgi:hypothetical protein
MESSHDDERRCYLPAMGDVTHKTARHRRAAMNVTPTLTEADQRELIAELRVQELAGHITESERRELTGAIWASNTPHEVYRRTHGLLGDPHPQGGWNVRRIAMFYLVIPVAMIVVTIFAALAVKMGLV